MIRDGALLVYLIGYRGSGKSASAKHLADRLRWDWLDADVMLEEHFACTIQSIFATDGEASFRDKETFILQQIAKKSKLVVATGGGIVLRQENRDAMSKGVVVWLYASAETLWRRIQSDQTTEERRPDLASGGLREVEEMLAKREQLYRQCADISFSTEDETPGEIAARIAEYLAQRFDEPRTK